MTIRGFLYVVFLCKRYISFNSSFVKFNMYYLILSSSTCQTSFRIIFRAYYCFIVVEKVVEKHKKSTERNLKIWLCTYGCEGRTDKPTHYRTVHRTVLPISFALRACFLETRSQVRVLFDYKIKKAVKRLLLLFGCGGRTRTCDLRVMSPTSFQLLYPAICCFPLRKLQ